MSTLTYRTDSISVGWMELDGWRGIKRSAVPRKELFVTTKLWIADVEYADSLATQLRNEQVEFAPLLTALERPEAFAASLNGYSFYT